MTQYADRVYSDAAETGRLSALCGRLEEEERVVLTLADGARVSGVVLAKPGLQTFMDETGREGVNALLKLDDVDGSGRARSLWLDEVVAVDRYAEDQQGIR